MKPYEILKTDGREEYFFVRGGQGTADYKAYSREDAEKLLALLNAAPQPTASDENAIHLIMVECTEWTKTGIVFDTEKADVMYARHRQAAVREAVAPLVEALEKVTRNLNRRTQEQLEGHIGLNENPPSYLLTECENVAFARALLDKVGG